MDGETIWWIAPVGVIYAVLFWVLSVRVPAVPLVLIFGLAPFQNDVSGFGGIHFSLSEVHLLLSVPLLMLKGWRGTLGWLNAPLWGGLILTFALTVPNWRDTSAVSLTQMGLYWVVAVAVFAQLPASRRDIEAAWKALLLVGCVMAGAALVNRSSYFWGLHKNGVGASLSCAFIIAVELWSTAKGRARWLYLGGVIWIAAGLLLVLSRGAWLAGMVGVFFLLMWRARYRSLIQLAILMVPVVFLIWEMLPQGSKEYATSFDVDRYNIKARVLNTEWAIQQWRSSPLIGVGAGLRKEYDATNVLWLTLAETGPLGLLAFLGVHVLLIEGIWSRRWSRSFNIASAASLAGAMVAGKFAHGLVDHYWSRGAIMLVWASVGMALFEEKNCRQSHIQLPNIRRGRRIRDAATEIQRESVEAGCS